MRNPPNFHLLIKVKPAIFVIVNLKKLSTKNLVKQFIYRELNFPKQPHFDRQTCFSKFGMIFINNHGNHFKKQEYILFVVVFNSGGLGNEKVNVTIHAFLKMCLFSLTHFLCHYFYEDDKLSVPVLVNLMHAAVLTGSDLP